MLYQAEPGDVHVADNGFVLCESLAPYRGDMISDPGA